MKKSQIWEGKDSSLRKTYNEAVGLNKKEIKSVARCANFMQFFKMRMWESWQKNNRFPLEVEMDEMAVTLWNYLRNEK